MTEQQSQTIKKFQEMVSKLPKDGNEILQSLTPEKCHYVHMAWALEGECDEFLEGIKHFYSGTLDHEKSIENLIEEAGDIEFYFNALLVSFYLNPQWMLLPSIHYDTMDEIRTLKEAAEELCMVSGKITDHIKKHVIYNKELNYDSLECVFEQFNDILHIIPSFLREGTTRDIIRQYNINKLSKRFGSDWEYSDQAAQTRADKQE